MNLEILCDFFLWCALINYAILLVWFVSFILRRDWIQRLHGRWFHLSADRFDTLHYGGMSVYKIGILLFNLVPYFALRIAG